MTERDVIARAFDARASNYDESAMHRGAAEAVATFVDLTAVSEVLDVATGTGLVLRALRERDQHLRLTGIDLSSGMLAVAKDAVPEAALIEGDAARLPLRDRSVDLVTCVTALHILPDVSAAIAEWRRVLRPGSRVVTATFSMMDGKTSGDDGVIGASRPYPRTHSPFRSVAALSRTAFAHGFSITRHTTWSDESDTVLIAEWAPES